MNEKDLYEKFVLKCEPIMDYLKKHHDPHASVIITQNNITITQDVMGFVREEKTNEI